jgi:NAD+ synthase
MQSAPQAIGEIVDFLRRAVSRYGYQGLVLGVSGGLDSAVAGKLAVEALGSQRVFGLLLPERDSAPETVRDSRLVCGYLGIRWRLRPITGLLRRTGIYRWVPPAGMFPRRVRERYALRRFRQDAREDGYLEDLLSQGDERFLKGLAYYRIKHRIRTALLYLEAERRGCAVLGTTNRTEWATGLCVKWGDDARDLEPLLHLYKSEVFQLAHALGVPEPILCKPPSPDIVPGITDELALGLPYADLDRILRKVEAGEDLGSEPADRVGRVQAILMRAPRRRLKNLHLGSPLP